MVIGVGIGILAAGSRAVAALVQPLVRVLAPLPKIALYPAMILMLGFDHSSKIALVVADAAVPDPARDLSGRGRGRAQARLVGARRRRLATQCLFTVVLMAALPSVLTGAASG